MSGYIYIYIYIYIWILLYRDVYIYRDIYIYEIYIVCGVSDMSHYFMYLVQDTILTEDQCKYVIGHRYVCCHRLSLNQNTINMHSEVVNSFDDDL